MDFKTSMIRKRGITLMVTIAHILDNPSLMCSASLLQWCGKKTPTQQQIKNVFWTQYSKAEKWGPRNSNLTIASRCLSGPQLDTSISRGKKPMHI
jgi:hypothetical protein